MRSFLEGENYNTIYFICSFPLKIFTKKAIQKAMYFAFMDSSYYYACCLYSNILVSLITYGDYDCVGMLGYLMFLLHLGVKKSVQAPVAESLHALVVHV